MGAVPASSVMLRPTVLCLFLACAVSLSSSAVILDNGMPILWAQTAGQVTDLPIQNGVLTPDPWNFLHRMSLYRLMIAATDPFMGSMGTNPTDGPMWGLPLQLGWMLTSGRLADPTGATTCGLQTGDTMCISTQSWWGCVNYLPLCCPSCLLHSRASWEQEFRSRCRCLQVERTIVPPTLTVQVTTPTPWLSGMPFLWVSRLLLSLLSLKMRRRTPSSVSTGRPKWLQLMPRQPAMPSRATIPLLRCPSLRAG